MGHLLTRLAAGVDFEEECSRLQRQHGYTVERVTRVTCGGVSGGETSRVSLAPSLGPAHRICLEPFGLALEMPVSTVEADVKVLEGS